MGVELAWQLALSTGVVLRCTHDGKRQHTLDLWWICAGLVMKSFNPRVLLQTSTAGPI